VNGHHVDIIFQTHSLSVLQANITISALRERVALLEYAIEHHGALMEEVRREEWAAAERRAAEVIVEYKRDLQRSLDEERMQMETDTHSLKMEIEVRFCTFSHSSVFPNGKKVVL
jgi:hypothetical protein